MEDFGCPQLSALVWAESPVGAEMPDPLLNQFRTVSVLASCCRPKPAVWLPKMGPFSRGLWFAALWPEADRTLLPDRKHVSEFSGEKVGELAEIGELTASVRSR